MKVGSSSSASFARKPSPWLLLLIAVALVLIHDAVVFHTRLYTPYLKPDSYAGRFQLLVNRELERRDSSFKEVLVLGDSRCAEGFSEKLALELLEPTRLRLYSGALNGSTPRLWYYLMRELLARGAAYSAVVVTLETYKDIDDGVNSASRKVDLQALSPVLDMSDMREFSASYGTWRETVEVICSLLLKGHSFKADIQDFLRSPGERLAAVGRNSRHFARWRFNYPGREGSMSGLTYDPESGDFQFGEDLSQVQKTHARRHLARVFAPQTGQKHQYRSLWLGRLVDLLRGHSIRVIFARLPNHPAFPRPEAHVQAPGAVSLLGSDPGVKVLADSVFAHLDRQELFLDALHLNREGRERFTRSLVRELHQALSGEKPAGASAPAGPGAALR